MIFFIRNNSDIKLIRDENTKKVFEQTTMFESFSPYLADRKCSLAISLKGLNRGKSMHMYELCHYHGVTDDEEGKVREAFLDAVSVLKHILDIL